MWIAAGLAAVGLLLGWLLVIPAASLSSAVSARRHGPPAAIAGGLVAAALAAWHPPLLVAAAYAAAAAVAIVAAIVDVADHRLPNRLTLPLLVGGVGVLAALTVITGQGSIGRAAAGLGIYGGLLLLAYLAGVGAGDVKLAAALGWWMGWLSWATLIAGMTVGYLLISAGYLIGRARQPRINRRSYRSPFGPGIAGGFLVSLLMVGLLT